MKFPKYVIVGITEMKLIKLDGDIATYYRHNGD